MLGHDSTLRQFIPRRVEFAAGDAVVVQVQSGPSMLAMHACMQTQAHECPVGMLPAMQVVVQAQLRPNAAGSTCM